MQLSGRHAVNVQRILEQFDPGNNNTKLIGAQIFMLQKSHQEQCAPPAPAQSHSGLDTSSSLTHLPHAFQEDEH